MPPVSRWQRRPSAASGRWPAGEHYNPLARYALMARHEEIHCSQFPGSLVGPIFAEQIEATIRHHALESGCFVVNATGWLTEAQIASVTTDPALQKALRGGCHTAIISPEGQHLRRRPCAKARHGGGRLDRPHHQAQAHDGFGGPLRAPRAAQPADQRPPGGPVSVMHAPRPQVPAAAIHPDDRSPDHAFSRHAAGLEPAVDD